MRNNIGILMRTIIQLKCIQKYVKTEPISQNTFTVIFKLAEVCLLIYINVNIYYLIYKCLCILCLYSLICFPY